MFFIFSYHTILHRSYPRSEVLCSTRAVASYFTDQGVEIFKSRSEFQNGFKRHLAVFCINCLKQSFVFSHLNGNYWLSTPGIKPIVVSGYEDVDFVPFIFGVQSLTYLYNSLQYSGIFIVLHGYKHSIIPFIFIY